MPVKASKSGSARTRCRRKWCTNASSLELIPLSRSLETVIVTHLDIISNSRVTERFINMFVGLIWRQMYPTTTSWKPISLRPIFMHSQYFPAFRFHDQNFVYNNFSHSLYMPCPSECTWFSTLILFNQGHKLWRPLSYFLQDSSSFSPFHPNLLSKLCSQISWICVLPLQWEDKFCARAHTHTHTPI